MTFARSRATRLVAAGPIGALLAVGLTVVPATTVHAQVVHHTRAAEVTGPLDRSEVRQLPFPARHVAVYWTANVDALVTVAFGTDGGTLGRATEVEHDEVGMQRDNGQTYGAVIPAGDATFARVTSDRPLGRLTVLALADGGTTVKKTTVPGKAAGAAATVLPRSEWGADESLRFHGGAAVWPPVFQTVQRLVVHHTAGANGESGDSAKATIRSIYYYHAVTQGWGDIGYNFLIDAAGVIYKGRSTSATPDDPDVTGENGLARGVTAAHAYGYNSGSAGVALLGNFVSTLPGQSAQDALKSFLIAKASAHGLHTAQRSLYTNPVNGTQATFENVPGHHEVPDAVTECPGGIFLESVFKSMRNEMVALAGPADTVPPANPTGLKTSVSKRSVQLRWTMSAGDTGNVGGGTSGVVGYDVWRSTAGGSFVRVGSTTDIAFTDTVSGPKAKRDYLVKTFDGSANRSTGASASVTA